MMKRSTARPDWLNPPTMRSVGLGIFLGAFVSSALAIAFYWAGLQTGKRLANYAMWEKPAGAAWCKVYPTGEKRCEFGFRQEHSPKELRAIPKVQERLALVK
jgi:hypothetical protein